MSIINTLKKLTCWLFKKNAPGIGKSQLTKRTFVDDEKWRDSSLQGIIDNNDDYADN